MALDVVRLNPGADVAPQIAAGTTNVFTRQIHGRDFEFYCWRGPIPAIGWTAVVLGGTTETLIVERAAGLWIYALDTINGHRQVTSPGEGVLFLNTVAGYVISQRPQVGDEIYDFYTAP
jgi:hypothetical protein